MQWSGYDHSVRGAPESCPHSSAVFPVLFFFPSGQRSPRAWSMPALLYPPQHTAAAFHTAGPPAHVTRASISHPSPRLHGVWVDCSAPFFSEHETDSDLTYQLSLTSGHRDWFQSGHVTSAGPVRVCSGISGENLRKRCLWHRGGWDGRVSLKLLGPSWGEACLGRKATQKMVKVKDST